MLHSVNDNTANLRIVASDSQPNHNLFRLLLDLNDDLLQKVIVILVPFNSATNVLSVEKTSTQHLVLPTRYELLQHLTSSSADQLLMIWTTSVSRSAEVFCSQWHSHSSSDSGSMTEKWRCFNVTGTKKRWRQCVEDNDNLCTTWRQQSNAKKQPRKQWMYWEQLKDTF